MNEALLGIAIAGFPFGLALGYGLGHKLTPPTDEQLARFMGRIVNQEEMEQHQRLVRLRMMRNGRTTQRVDSGPNAKISKMRLAATSRRFRKQ